MTTTHPEFAEPRPNLLERIRQGWQHGDGLYRLLLLLASLSVLLLVLAIGYALWQNSALSRAAFGWRFLVTSEWDPALTNTFGALPFIMGTLTTSAIALIIAVPLGLGTAIFLSELSPRWLKQPVGFLVELLAAIPSVVYGLWGLFAFVPALVHPA